MRSQEPFDAVLVQLTKFRSTFLMQMEFAVDIELSSKRASIGVRNGRQIEVETGVKWRSKRASNRGRNGRQIEVETGVKLSSKRTSIQTIHLFKFAIFAAAAASGAFENFRVSANEATSSEKARP